MESIRMYVENMFKVLPQTEEINRIKAEMLENMEEKYQELKDQGKSENEAIGIVISEFGNIDELINEMGIQIAEEPEKQVTDAEIDNAILAQKKSSKMIAFGVSLILFGASIFFVLNGLIENKVLFASMNQDTMDIFPLIILLLFVIPAVGIFIFTGTQMEQYKYIEEGRYSLSVGQKARLTNDYQNEKMGTTVHIIVGVCLCILSAVPLFIGSMIRWKGEDASIYGLSITVLIVMVAVYLFITSGGNTGMYRKFLRLDDNGREKHDDKVVNAVAAIIWPIAVCVFLVWGFLFDGWAISWIVFPITGILFGGFAGLRNALYGEK